MRFFKNCISFTLALMLCLGCVISAEAASPRYAKGDKLQDFTFTTYDGQTITLSDVLKDKDAVLINIWATWCGPCRNEFPFLEEAYRQYQDRVEVIALSCEPSDTADTLASFAAEYGLSFKIGQDPVGFLNALGVNSIPTSLVVDRFGTICFIESGSQPDVASFVRLFDAFVGDDYTSSVLLDGIPSSKPTIAASSEAELSAALEASCVNPDNAYFWPMVASEKDGRYVVASSNAGLSSTVSSIGVNVYAEAGDAIVVTFKTSTEAVYDLLNISLNENTMKVFGGSHDWMTYAIPVENTGHQQLVLAYVKNEAGNVGEDTIWIDKVTVATGNDATAALADNPVYPIAEENTLTVTTPGAKEVQISDDAGLLYANFGPAKYYIINADVAAFDATLTQGYDPEGAFFFCNYDGNVTPVVEGMTTDRYTAVGGVDSMQTTGYTYACMVLYCDARGSDMKCIVYFRDEANLNRFVNENQLGTWTYANTAVGDGTETTGNDMSVYTLKCIDQNGLPVPDAMLQVCDDYTCHVYMSDENGLCEFETIPYAWEVHVLLSPEGYTADFNESVYTPVEGGEMVFTFTKQ